MYTLESLKPLEFMDVNGPGQFGKGEIRDGYTVVEGPESSDSLNV